jgi:cytochrome c553
MFIAIVCVALTLKRTKNMKQKILLGAIFFAFVNTSVLAEEMSKGQTKSEACVSCHGVGGKSLVPTFPRLAGQHAVYLESTLKDFRSGERKNAMMSPFATGLSDEDIHDLAVYFEAQK